MAIKYRFFLATQTFPRSQIPKSNASQSILLRYKLTKIYTRAVCFFFGPPLRYKCHQLIFYYHVNAATHSCLFHCNIVQLFGLCIAYRIVSIHPHSLPPPKYSLAAFCFVHISLGVPSNLQCSLFILWMKFRVSRSSSFFMSVEWCFANFFLSLSGIPIFYEHFRLL